MKNLCGKCGNKFAQHYGMKQTEVAHCYFRVEEGKMLTLEKLKEMEPGEIIATGTVSDNPVGINITNSGKLLRYVAVRGKIHDWAIYIHFAEWSVSEVRRNGDKVFGEENIKKLVPCDDEAFALYRY